MPESDTAPKLDDETTAALTLFNEYVEADRERTQREKRIKKAERAKDEAAALVKKLNERGSAEEKAEAEAAYRVAADRWKKLRDGEEPDDVPAPVEESTASSTDEAEAEAEGEQAEAPEAAQVDAPATEAETDTESAAAKAPEAAQVDAPAIDESAAPADEEE